MQKKSTRFDVKPTIRFTVYAYRPTFLCGKGRQYRVLRRVTWAAYTLQLYGFPKVWQNKCSIIQMKTENQIPSCVHI